MSLQVLQLQLPILVACPALLRYHYLSDDRVVRASASGAVDLGLIPSRVKPITLKLVFTASLLDAQHERDSVKNKPASLLVIIILFISDHKVHCNEIISKRKQKNLHSQNRYRNI